MAASSPPPRPLWRARAYNVVEASTGTYRNARIFNVFMVLMIVGNVFAVILETDGNIEARYGAYFSAFEVFSVAVFSIEYLMRLWVCVEDKSLVDKGHLIGRLRYAMTGPALIDLAAILPAYLGLWVPVDLRILRVLRLLRLLKLTRYSPALETFGAVLFSQRRALLAAGLIIMAMLVFSSSVVYLLENEAQPESFGSIPKAMWWAMATLATVGYGDVTPQTPLGKLFGGLVMVIGIGMFAMPTGIIATGFATELKKRDFVISWGLVAKVPLFSKLDAVGISEIVSVLKPKMVPSRYAIVNKNEPADDMYFIAAGEVEVLADQGVFKLGSGDFFGEIALLEDTTRTATVIAATECHLLILNRQDFKHLLQQHDEIREELHRVTKKRRQKDSAAT